MSDGYWSVKRSAYAVVCITPDYHGTVIVWDTLEEAENDIEERIEDFFSDDVEKERFYFVKVDDGYEIRCISDEQIVQCYKIFEEQELE